MGENGYQQSLSRLVGRLSVHDEEGKAPLPTRSNSRSNGIVWQKKECPRCAYTWLDNCHKDECPKCLLVLSRWPILKDRRLPGEASTYKSAPNDSLRASFGNCRQGGEHAFQFGRCQKCGTGQGYAGPRVEDRFQGGATHTERRRRCSVCSFTWLDKYRKLECPKCLQPSDVKASMLTCSDDTASQSSATNGVRKHCQRCSHSWLDVKGSTACPICNRSLKTRQRLPTRNKTTLPTGLWR